MSVRKKLMISNILIFIVPIIFGIFIISLVFSTLERKFIHNSDLNKLKKIEKAFFDFDKDELLHIFKQFEKQDFQISFKSKDFFDYTSENYQENFLIIVGNELNSKEPDTYSISNKYGKAACYTLYNKDSSALLTVLNTNNAGYRDQYAFTDESVHYIKNMFLLALLSIILVVAITISILTYLISKSILKPLKLLREGTQEIQNGNLDHSIIYPKKDEFGELCSDFESMRKSLRTLKEEERKYEENRKELIAGISHDLNTPLTSIKGYVSGLLDGIINTTEKRISYLRNINQIADKMSKLVEELLLYSTLDMNAVSFVFENIDLIKYFEDCLSEIKDEFKQSNINIIFEPECTKAIAKIDLMHFNRVVLNILGNSVKYRKNNMGNILISISQQNENYKISFKDDGYGISNLDSEDIFKVFYRSDKSRNQTTGGNGLGLAIVKRIVKAHGGQVSTNKDYKDGLEIVILLPVFGLK